MKNNKIQNKDMKDVEGQGCVIPECCYDCSHWKNNVPPRLGGCTQITNSEISTLL